MRRFVFAPLCAVFFGGMALFAWNSSALTLGTILAVLGILSFACLVEPKSPLGSIGMVIVSVVAMLCLVGFLDGFFDDDC